MQKSGRDASHERLLPPHPVEWNIGEAAGALAAFCVAQKKSPREVRNNTERLADFQKLLRADGVRLEWPAEAGAI